MGQSRHNTDMSMSENEIKVLETPEEAVEGAEAVEAKPKKTAPKRIRSKKYQAVRSQVDKTRSYDVFSALELVKKLSYTKFPGTITAEVVLREKETGSQIDLAFPHSTGQSLTVVVATDEVLDQITAGNINFDILVSTPQYMPKLAKLAAVLGPRGLMPNPKNGTLTENPERKKAELEAGKVTLRTERKAPLMHVVIGNSKMDTKQLVENIQTLLDALKGRLLKVAVAASMSPGIKVAVE
jgi:large subunit ribosomal protein L1